jgi:hypothetical protein
MLELKSSLSKSFEIYTQGQGPLVYIRKLSYAFLKRYLLQYPKHFRLVSETLSLFWANQIFYLHLDAALLAENQKMLILKSLVLPDQESNPWSTAQSFEIYTQGQGA